MSLILGELTGTVSSGRERIVAIRARDTGERTPRGNAAGCISCAIGWPASRRPRSRWRPRWPDAADLLRAAEDKVVAYMTFPTEG